MAPNQYIRKSALACLGIALLDGAAVAQQLVRNTTDIPASSSYTENVDFGDVDNDGDWDAIFANGGDQGNDQSEIWTNNGFAQGGTVGIFTNVTATQFPAISTDARDIEFVDFDNDNDIDIYLSNTTQVTPTNNSNRWWTNMGGVQAGSIGFYQDQTAARWIGLAGAGSSIAPSQLGGNGGFIDFSCDCDFGDLDNDGDLDLVHSTYGGAFGGNVPTRLFLNNGSGNFTEHNPSGFQLTGQNINAGNPGLWCQGVQTSNTTNTTGANCDIASTALDIQVGDIDGDLDLDLLHGARQEPPRMFQNRLQEQSTLIFRDITGSAFPAGYTSGSGHYEQEFGDMDGDGDWDIYGLNWQSPFNDITMKNNGSGVYGSLAVLGGSGADDNEGDFIDYDNDGDLDLFVANFSGQDRMYQNNGTGTLALQATGVAIPSDSTTSLDADATDVDNDGDYDIFVANDANQAEWYLKNGTAANDNTAPALFRLEQAPNRNAGPTPTVVRVQVYDNASYYTTWYNDTVLEYTVNAGATQTVTMESSAGQIFRGEIPGALVGTIAYRAVSTDQYGNTGNTAFKSYEATTGTTVGTPSCIGFSNGACPCAPGLNPGAGCGNESTTPGHGGSLLDGSLLSGTSPSVADDTGTPQVQLNMSLAPPGKSAIFLQGTATVSPVFFYDGLRCTGGSLVRLNGATPAGDLITGGGTLTYPNAAHPQSIVDRSASLGQPIGSGETRHYFTQHRIDANPNACIMNLTGNGNTTNALTIVWGP